MTQDTGVGGGHRDIFEHLNRLRARGHDVELYTLGGPPDWFPLEAPVRTFGSYEELAAALAREDAIKVATWWETAHWVWRASVTRGIPVYFVQDIETSYYPGDPAAQTRARQLPRGVPLHDDLGLEPRAARPSWASSAELIPPGIDLDSFRPLDRPSATTCCSRSAARTRSRTSR